MFNGTNVTTNEEGNKTSSPTLAPTSSSAMSAAGWLGSYIPEPFLNEYDDVPYFVKLIFPLIGIVITFMTLSKLNHQPVTTRAVISHANTVAFCIAFLPESLIVAGWYYVASSALTAEAYYGGRRTHVAFGLFSIAMAITITVEITLHEIRAGIWTYIVFALFHFAFIRTPVTISEEHPPQYLKRLFFLDAVVAVVLGITFEKKTPDVTWLLFGMMNLLKGVALFRLYAPTPPTIPVIIPLGMETHVASPPVPPPPTTTKFRAERIHPSGPTEAPIDLRDDFIGNEDVTARI